jgi:hypothetical protein
MVEKRIKKSINKNYRTIKANWSCEKVKKWLVDMNVNCLQNSLSSFNGHDLLLLSKTDIKLICDQNTSTCNCNKLIEALSNQSNTLQNDKIETIKNKVNFLVRYSNSNLYHLIELNELSFKNLQSKLQTLFGKIFTQISFQIDEFYIKLDEKNINKFIENYKKYSLVVRKSSLVILKDC